MEALKQGKSLQRAGWNGKDQFVYLVKGEKLASALGYGFGEYLENLGDRHYDLVFCECAHHDPGTVNDILRKTPTDRMVIHHLNLEREPYLTEFAKEAPFHCQIAEDGLTIEL